MQHNGGMRKWALLAAATGLAACSPPYRPASTELTAAAPAEVEHEAYLFEGSGGVRLFAQHWRPKQGARAVLVVVHGLKDHSNRYAALAERLTAQGFAVHALDLRGHAHSEGIRVYVRQFNDYLADLDRFMAHVRAREAQRPVFLFGHSMGGAIATLYTIDRKPDIAGLALSGAALKYPDDAPGVLRFATRMTSALLPESGVFQLDLDKFSRDPQVVADAKSDPLVYQPGAPARTAAAVLDAISRIQDHMEDVSVPLLAMHGAADKVTPPEGSKELYARARSTDKTLKLYEGLFHDILHEPEKDRVAGDLVAWLTAHAPSQ